MLTIQPAQSRIAFEARPLRPEQINNLLRRGSLSPEQIAVLEEQDLTPEQTDRLNEIKYNNQYDEILEQRDEVTKLAGNKDFPMPDAAKKALKGGAVITTGVLGGMAAGWGTGKTIKGFKKIYSTEYMKGVRAQLKAFNKFAKETAKTTKLNFISSEAYKLHKARLEKAHNSKFWGPVLKFFGKIGKGIKFAFVKTKNGINHVINKIKGVKKETWEKATVNTVGVSGGIASGVEAARKSSEEK